MRARIIRAVSAPVLVAGIIFFATVLSTIVMLMAQSHSPEVGEDQNIAFEPIVPGDQLEAIAGMVRVHIVGEVLTPGVVELVAGARVEDAIEAAGGATEAAVLSAINLAKVLVDGEQLIVPNEQSAVSAPVGAVSEGKININLADIPALETLSGVGPELAQRIIDWRESNGGFKSVDQLREVSGIGQKKFEGFREQVFV